MIDIVIEGVKFALVEYGALGVFVLVAGAVLWRHFDKVVTNLRFDVRSLSSELINKEAKLAEVSDSLRKAEEQLIDFEKYREIFGNEPLPKLRAELVEKLELIAHAVSASAASLYIPIFNKRDAECEMPRGFAFVAVFNKDAKAMRNIQNVKMVETWGLVGQCWESASYVLENELQRNVRHLSSYDSDSGFLAVHTLLVPVKINNIVIGVLQVFNKLQDATSGALSMQGFTSDDAKILVSRSEDKSSKGVSKSLNYFVTEPNAELFLEINDDTRLENAVIMYIDLTRSSTIFHEIALSDVAKLIGRFNDYLYRRVLPCNVVVEKFNGDGVLIRFHYGGFKPRLVESNPVHQAVRVAAKIVENFDTFKREEWKLLTQSAVNEVKIRVCLALGKVISTNVGPRQFPTSTVLGLSVNRAAKMATYATRDRHIVLLDDNVRKALLQIDRHYANMMKEYKEFEGVKDNASLARHHYYELEIESYIKQTQHSEAS